MIKILFSVIFFCSIANASLLNFYYLKKAQDAYRAKNFKQALKYLKYFDEDLDYLNYDLANIYYKLKDYSSAVKYYKRAYGSNVKESDRLFNLGNSYLKLKQFDNAILCYKKALEFTNDSDIINNLQLAQILKQKSKDIAKTSTIKGKTNPKEHKIGKKIEKRKKSKLSQELKKMLEKNLKNKKVPVIMYKIKDSNNIQLKPW